MPVILVKNDPRRAAANTTRGQRLPKASDFPSLEEAMKLLGYKPWPTAPVMQLPIEVREQIWEEVITHEVGTEIRIRPFINDLAARPRFLPACLLVSRQIKREMTPVLIRTVKFRTSSIGDNQFLRRFLDSADAGRKHVRALQFDCFDLLPPNISVNQDLKLAASCKGLKDLYVAFHWSNLHHSVEYLARRYCIHEILECKSLTFFGIIPKGHLREEEKATAEELIAWVVDEFKNQGQNVTGNVL